MARSIFCKPCGDWTVGRAKEFAERYRSYTGTVRRGCLCDHCCVELRVGDQAVAFTTHPHGPDNVRPWEDYWLNLSLVGA